MNVEIYVELMGNMPFLVKDNKIIDTLKHILLKYY